MATATTEAAQTVEDAAEKLFRLTLGTYWSMVEHGQLTEDDKVELLDGLLVEKMTKGDRHLGVTEEVFMLLLGCLPTGYFPRKEDPVNLPGGPEGDSVPEPDVVVLAGSRRDFKRHIPGPADMRLVVEVADSSLSKDRRGLTRLAWAGVPLAWIVNLRNDTVEVYTGPSGPGIEAGYAEMTVKKPGDMLEFMLDGARVGPIAVADILT